MFLPKVLLALVIVVMCAGSVHAQPDAVPADNKAVSLESPGEQESSIPFKTNAPDQNISVSRVVITFLLLVFVLVVTVYVVKRFGADRLARIGGQGSRLKVVETKRISPKSSVVLLSADGKDYIVVQSGDAVSIILHENAVQDDI